MEVDRIAEELESLAPEQTLEAVLAANQNTHVCLTSSFQAEDMVVAHLLRKRMPDFPVLFLDTGYHFPQTYEYRDRMTREWSLNLVNVLPTQTVAEQESAFGILYRSEPTRCCQLRKVEPLMRALEPFDIWFTGLRREQSPTRKNLKKIEEHRLPSGRKLLKVSLLADWTWGQVWEYTAKKHGNSRRPEQPSLGPLGRNKAGMRNPHVFREGPVMYYLVGFIIAIAVGLTGIGGGSFTVPALVLLTGLTAGEAVGTAFLFAGVLRLIAAPFYLLGKQIHSRYLWLLLQGAVPGLLVGTWALRILNRDAGNPYVIVLLGVLLAASSSVTFIRRVQNPAFAGKNHRWLPWLALPIGMESGFSSAGAGALGTVLLLNYSEMTPAQVVGTDLLFGLVLALIGSAFHWTFGSISMPILFQLLLGGVPGVVFGCLLAKRVPANKLKTAVALVAIFAGLQLVWTGSRSLASRRATNAAKITAQAGVGHAR